MLLPTGRSPQTMYAVLRAHARAGHLPPGTATVLQLDEYAGLGPGDPRSFAAQLRAQLEGIPLGAIRTIDGAAPDPAAEAARHAAVLEEAPIDLAVLGLGRDGHVAFDEPPARMASGVAVVSLAGMTREDAAPAFGGAEHVPARALTTGLGTLYRARELILLVSGAAKAPALRAMLEDPVDARSPASLLRDHPRLTIICDREAASLLKPRPGFSSDRVIVVLGHRDPGVSAEHQISAESRARLRHGLRLARRSPVRAVVLTGYTSTGGLSEAEQMKTAWDEHVAPALLEVAGRDTAENAVADAADPARARRGARRSRWSPRPGTCGCRGSSRPTATSASTSATGPRLRTATGGACSARSSAARGAPAAGAAPRWRPCTRRLRP